MAEGVVAGVARGPDKVLYDAATGRWVAVKVYLELAVVYEEIGEMLTITAVCSSRLGEVVAGAR